MLSTSAINLVPHEPAREGLLAYGALGHPNFLGTYTVFLLPAPVWFYLRSGSAMWLICSNLLCAGLLVSLYRDAWLDGLVIALVVVAHTVRYVSKKRYPPHGGSFCARNPDTATRTPRDPLGTCAFGGTPDRRGTTMQDAAGSGKFSWKKLVQLVPEFWAFGVEPDHVIYGRLIISKGVVVDKVHNVFLEILVLWVRSPY